MKKLLFVWLLALTQLTSFAFNSRSEAFNFLCEELNYNNDDDYVLMFPKEQKDTVLCEWTWIIEHEPVNETDTLIVSDDYWLFLKGPRLVLAGDCDEKDYYLVSKKDSVYKKELSRGAPSDGSNWSSVPYYTTRSQAIAAVTGEYAKDGYEIYINDADTFDLKKVREENGLGFWEFYVKAPKEDDCFKYGLGRGEDVYYYQPTSEPSNNLKAWTKINMPQGATELVGNKSVRLWEEENGITLLTEEEITTMALYSATGQKVTAQAAANPHFISVNTSALPGGIYILEAVISGKKYSHKVVKR